MPETRVLPVAISELREHAGELIRAHYLEIAKHRDLMVLDPDWDTYEKIEAADRLFALAAYVGDQMAGYSVTLIGSHLHYQGLVVATNDAIFLAKEHRHARVGATLLRATEAQARARGARLMTWHAKPGEGLDLVLRGREDYPVQDIVYARRI